MPTDNHIQFKLAVLPAAQLASYAQTNNLSRSAAAKHLLEKALAQLHPAVGGSEKAYGDLLKQVEAIVVERRERDNWDEHVTLETFQHIRQNFSALHAAAISGGNKSRVHRDIGGLVRSTLAAVTRRDDKGDLMTRQLSRNSGELIQSYTLLFRPENS